MNSQRSIGFEIKTLDNMITRKIIQNSKDELFPITQVQFIIIKHINKNNKVYQKDLEELLHMRRSTISGILKTMEKNNLIKRIDSNEDARVKQIVLTDKCIEYKKKIKKRKLEFDKLLSKDISPEELKVFFKVVDKIKDNISN